MQVMTTESVILSIKAIGRSINGESSTSHFELCVVFVDLISN
jgi:hypothetical protein